MDAFSVIYAAAALLPIILITVLCISCRKKIPVHITETGYYDDKPPITPPSANFMIVRHQLLPRTVSSQATMCHQDVLLTIPSSPASKTRRSSAGREITGYGSDSMPHSPSAPVLISQSIGDDEAEDGNYNHDHPAYGYIQVLPDEEVTKLGPCNVDNRASLSSVGTDENYVNVEKSDDAKASSGDDNYVNVHVRKPSDTKGAPVVISQSIEDDDYDEGEDGLCTTDNPAYGYTQVLPDEEVTKLGPCDVDNRASLSSVGTDENYENVENSNNANATSVDDNYVNVTVTDPSDTKDISWEHDECSYRRFENGEDAEMHPSSINQESEDDDMSEYENVEKGHKG